MERYSARNEERRMHVRTRAGTAGGNNTVLVREVNKEVGEVKWLGSVLRSGCEVRC